MKTCSIRRSAYRLLKFLAIWLIASSTALQAQTNSLTDVLEDDGNFSILIDLLTTSNLSSAFESGTYTLFAPTDEAFSALDDELSANLQARPEVLLAILTNHVVEGELRLIDLQDANEGSIMSLAEEPLDFNLTLGGLTVNGADIDSDDTGIAFANGVIHEIDGVILPQSLQGTGALEAALLVVETEDPDAVNADTNSGETTGTGAEATAVDVATEGTTVNTADAATPETTDTEANDTGADDETTGEAAEATAVDVETKGTTVNTADADIAGDDGADSETMGEAAEATAVEVETEGTTVNTADADTAATSEAAEASAETTGEAAEATAVDVATEDTTVNTADAETPETTASGETTGEAAEATAVDVATEDTTVNTADADAPDMMALSGAALGADLIALLEEQGGFSDLIAAIEGADLDSLATPFTLFAPTDEAFAALAEDALEGADTETLLLYHILPDRVESENLVGNKPDNDTSAEGERRDGLATTLEGRDVLITLQEGGSYTLNNERATVTEADIRPADAAYIVHVIDAVLIPTDMAEEVSDD